MRRWVIVIGSAVLAAASVVLLAFVVGGNRLEDTTQPTGQAGLRMPSVNTTVALQAGPADLLTTPPATQLTTPPTTQPATLPPREPVLSLPEMDDSSAKQLFVYDVGREEMLFFQGDLTKRIEPASLTKLFTAYVAMQYLEPEQIISVGEEAGWIASDSSVAWVSRGCRLSVGMALQGMLMQSGNDAAYAIAVAAGRAIENNQSLAALPAYKTFISEMNRQLQELGLTGTHFVNPDGYHHQDHYTTAEDLLQIALLVLDDPLIMECCGTDFAEVRYESGQRYTWRNTNWLLHTDSGYYCAAATGLKTGTTYHAGNCLIASFDAGDTILLVGVLGADEVEHRFSDALYLFTYFE